MPRYVRADSDLKSERETPLLPSASITEDGTSIVQTALNLANGLEGMGLLALPFTVVLAGSLAFAIIVFVAMLSSYSACAIIASLYSRSSAPSTQTGGSSLGSWARERASYQDIGKAAFGERGGRLVLYIQLITLLAVAGLFVVLVANTLADAIPGTFLGRRGWTVVSWAAVAPTAWIKSLRQISWLSGAGVALLAFLVSAMVYAAAVAVPAVDPQQLVSSDSGMAKSSLALWQARQLELPELSFRAVPCVFGMVLFSFSCHTMLPAMEAAMRPSDRRHFPAVIGLTFAACTMLKAVFMMAGWLAFGLATPSVAIVALEPMALRVFAAAAVTLNTALTVPMILFIIQMVLHSALAQAVRADESAVGSGSETVTEKICKSEDTRRAAIVIVVLVLVLAVPDLTEIMALAGSFASTSIVFVLPLVCHLRIRYQEMGDGLYEPHAFHKLVVGHTVVLVVGMAGGCMGLANALSKCS